MKWPNSQWLNPLLTTVLKMLFLPLLFTIYMPLLTRNQQHKKWNITLLYITSDSHCKCFYSVFKKTGPLQLISRNFTNSQRSLIIFCTERSYSILNSKTEMFLNWLRISCVVSITTAVTWHTWTADFWANYKQRIIDRPINDCQNDCKAVLMPKDGIRTRVVPSATAKYFTILIETLFV